ncbi:DUF2145 domain-containing protein [Caenimonas sedimenti]|uniref:DUF2145 domain-containing protein n=2 Tax=Caenimonas sedimenti TaxID=2596921 RepID=A0A562ZNC9_9BURK|nr:DUF2145 domain-containing protein [Caenimonas sedimenti]TWO69871.1 DUF2145 domain-containing protein [Caenimonas sedimenti]
MTFAIAAVLLVAQPAQAGRSCDAKKPSAATIERGLTLAERTHLALEADHARNGTQAVLLARAGQDLTKYGLRYSHLGIAYRTRDAQGGVAWRVLHKLNHCGTAEAAIYRQGLGEFFLDDLWRFEAAWVVPTPALQAQLVAVLKDESRAVRLHHKPYSIVSYVWGQRYQQSNQWAIETLAQGVEPGIASRAQAQAWLQFKGYLPTTLRLGPLTRLGARASAANVAFDDHPDAKRFSDRIETVTVDSVFAWLQRSGLGGAPVAVRL